jgi:hypothetical protein
MFTGWDSYPNLRKLNLAVFEGTLEIQGNHSCSIKKWAASDISGNVSSLTGLQETDPTNLTNISSELDAITSVLASIKTTGTSYYGFAQIQNQGVTNCNPRTIYTYDINLFLNASSFIFDAENDPDATFILWVGGVDITNGTSNTYTYLNGAKKENVFFYVDHSILTYAGASLRPISFNFFSRNVDGTFLSNFIDGMRLRGGLYLYNCNVSFTGDDVNIITEPTTTINDYPALKNLSFLSNSITFGTNQDQVLTTSGYQAETITYSLGGTISGDPSAYSYDDCSSNQISLENYLMHEIYDVCPNQVNVTVTTPLTMYSTNNGYCYILSTPLDTYHPFPTNITIDGSGNPDATFFIYCPSIKFQNDVTFSKTSNEIFDNVFIYVNNYIYPGHSISPYAVNIITPQTFQTESGQQNVEMQTRFFARGFDFEVINSIIISSSNVICFRKGTLIHTPFGPKKVECLCKHDVVYVTGKIENNAMHRYDAYVAKPIVFVGKRRTLVNDASAPVKIPQDIFEKGSPSRDLYVSRNHGIIVDGTLIPAYKLMETHGLEQCFEESTVEYYHVELDDHFGILAENVHCESFLDCNNKKSLTEVVRRLKKTFL